MPQAPVLQASRCVWTARDSLDTGGPSHIQPFLALPIGSTQHPKHQLQRKGMCSLRRVHIEQGRGTRSAQGVDRPSGHTGLRSVPALLGTGKRKAVVLLCITISKPVSQSPVQHSVSLLPWRSRLGLEALSFSVSVSRPISRLLPLCRCRGAKMTLVRRP